MTVRVDSERQASRPVSADHHHAVVIMNSDMEAFGNRLSAIVNADFYNAALNAGPVDVPLGKAFALCSIVCDYTQCMFQAQADLMKLCLASNSLLVPLALYVLITYMHWSKETLWVNSPSWSI